MYYRKFLRSRIYPLIFLISFILIANVGVSKTTIPLDPPTEIQDQIIHNKGNIATTIQNWGQIGGQSDLGKPSGEWLKGSGHHYLAEIKYWMGVIKPNGDTVVANTREDFMPLPMPLSGGDSYRIRLSTDPSTYDYDEYDTVGSGVGKPAYGWRVWDLEKESWEYNRVWNLATSEFEGAGPISLQESHYRFNDANSGISVLGLEITQTIYQWNYSYNEDFMFVVLEIKNKSSNDYSDFAFGLYCDFDVGGFHPPTGENGRLGDLVKFDSTMNLAWTYDEDGYDPGWGPLVKTGIMGTKYIETPDNIGMTAFRTGQWEYLPDNDPGRYEFINSQQFDQSLPPTDQYYIQCTRGINLTSGKTVRVVFALIAGYDEADLKEKASMAQTVYENYFIGPEPPQTPNLVVTSGDGLVKLLWDNVAENSVDPLSGILDFKGYKIYRSTDMGLTWGDLVKNSDGSLGPDYVPIAIFQKDSEADVLPHTYIDGNLTNGIEYWYTVVAFDKGDTTVPIDALQNAYGRPGEDPNCEFAMPRTDPAGYYSIESTVEHRYTGAHPEDKSDGSVGITVFDQEVLTGHQYKVVFSDDPIATKWHVIDMFTQDTVLMNQTKQSGDVNEYPVVDGIQVLVFDGIIEVGEYGQTEFSTPGDTTLHMGYFYGTTGETFGWPVGGGMHFTPTFEIRFTETGSEGYWLWDDMTTIHLPFEVWNVTEGYQVIAEIYDSDFDQVWNIENKEYIDIVNIPYDGNPHPEAWPYYHSWFFRFGVEDINWAPGDVFRIEGTTNINKPGDEFVFAKEGIDENSAKRGLANIKVVPNPYIARADWETTEGVRKVQFTHLPKVCTIRIYTLAGDLVQTIEHDNGSGTEDWNLLSENQQGISSGVYFYHVSSEYGEKIGKLAVIK
jgi:hypothetical protein